MGEHVVLFDSYDSVYPGADGRIPIPPGTGLLDLPTALSFVAAQTSSLRLGTGVCILPQANPVYTAKHYASVDVLSGGRLEFGFGVGWSAEEYAACGVPFERRGDRCDEYIEVIRRLWYDERSSFVGQYYSLPECVALPKPVQRPVPLYVGGASDAALRRTARLSAGWFALNPSPEEVTAGVARLLSLGAARTDVVAAFNQRSITADAVPEYAEGGVDRLLLPYFPSRRTVGEMLDRYEPILRAAAACSSLS